MDEDDYIKILKYLRELVRNSDFLDIDEMASMESRLIKSSKHQLEEYLQMVISMLTERSGSEAINTYDRFSRVLEVEQGNSFQGIDVELTDSESTVYDINKYSMHELDDYSPVILELKKVLNELKFEPEPPTNDFNRGSSF